MELLEIELLHKATEMEVQSRILEEKKTNMQKEKAQVEAAREFIASVEKEFIEKELKASAERKEVKSVLPDPFVIKK